MNPHRNRLRTRWAGLYGRYSLNCVSCEKGDTRSICWSVIFEENGLRITATALSGYMKKLNGEAERVSAIEVRKAENTTFATWFVSLQTLGNETGCTAVRKGQQ